MQPSNPSPEERGLRERVLSALCPECGHTVGWHGENHDDGCNHYDASGHCPCGLNARDCHAKIDKSADLDAYARAVYERCLRDAMAVVEEEALNSPYPKAFVLNAIAELIERALTPPESTE